MITKVCKRRGKDFEVKPHRSETAFYRSKECYRPPYQEEDIVASYLTGKSCYDVGEVFGCSWSTVRNILIKRGVALRDSGSYAVSDRRTTLTAEHRQIIDGLLLGDGCVRRHKNAVTACMSVTTVEEEFANHLVAGLPLNLRINSEEACQRIIRGKAYNCKKSYRIYSTVDLSLNEYRNRWYPNSTKVIPVDLKLTPISIKYWFYGDGTTTYRKYKNVDDAYVSLAFCTNGFTVPDCELLIQKLLTASGVRFGINYNKGQPVLVCRDIDSVNRFFDFIGDCGVACYQYKWKRPTTNSSLFKYRWNTHKSMGNANREVVLQLSQDEECRAKAKSSGCSLSRQISKESGIEKSVVQRILGFADDAAELISADFSVVARLTHKTDEFVDAIRDMLADQELASKALSVDLSVPKYIARCLGRSYSAVRTHLKELGHETHEHANHKLGRKRLNTDKKEKEVVTLFNQPQTKEEALDARIGVFNYIAKRIGRGVDFVRKTMKKNGVDQEPIAMSVLTTGRGKGYDFNKHRNKWRVRLCGKEYGWFSTEEAAKVKVAELRKQQGVA